MSGKGLVAWTGGAGAVGGAVNGLMLWVAWPTGLLVWEPDIILAGAMYGAAVSLMIAYAARAPTLRKKIGRAVTIGLLGVVPGLYVGFMALMASFNWDSLIGGGPRRLDGEGRFAMPLLPQNGPDELGMCGNAFVADLLLRNFSSPILLAFVVVLALTVADHVATSGLWARIGSFVGLSVVAAVIVWSVGCFPIRHAPDKGFTVRADWKITRMALTQGACFGLFVALGRCVKARPSCPSPSPSAP